MKVRKTKDIKKVLNKKGFQLYPQKDHHEFYYLVVDGIKYDVYTYLSHGGKEYGANLMGMIKKQLKFNTSQEAENFFDCPMSKDQYIKLLTDNKSISLPTP